MPAPASMQAFAAHRTYGSSADKPAVDTFGLNVRYPRLSPAAKNNDEKRTIAAV